MDFRIHECSHSNNHIIGDYLHMNLKDLLKKVVDWILINIIFSQTFSKRYIGLSSFKHFQKDALALDELGNDI